ncbi:MULTISPECIES: hypothetical protein [unclassified Schlesneria]|uniref:hypothetical protein n=1 Tax=Schlesneria TaxID=656899 RepID=UPI002F0ABF14
MDASSYRATTPSHIWLCHFLEMELQNAELVSLRRNGQAGLDALKGDLRYANALALLDALSAEQQDRANFMMAANDVKQS